MIKEEFDILGIKKSKEGKSYEEIKTEINNLENYQKEIKSDKKLIVSQQKIIEKLEKTIEKQKKEIFNLGLKGEDKEAKNISIGDLTKIIATVSFDTVPKQEVRVLCHLSLKKVNCALNFLKRNNIIKEENKQGIYFYSKC